MADEFKSNFTIQNMQQDLNISEYDQTSVASEVPICAQIHVQTLKHHQSSTLPLEDAAWLSTCKPPEVEFFIRYQTMVLAPLITS